MLGFSSLCELSLCELPGGIVVVPPEPPPIGGGGPGTGSGGSGGLWHEGGKRHDVRLEDFEIFIRLARKRPEQTIQQILRELDEKGPQPARPIAHIEVRYTQLTREHPQFRPIKQWKLIMPPPARPKVKDYYDEDTEVLLIMLSVL